MRYVNTARVSFLATDAHTLCPIYKVLTLLLGTTYLPFMTTLRHLV